MNNSDEEATTNTRSLTDFLDENHVHEQQKAYLKPWQKKLLKSNSESYKCIEALLKLFMNKRAYESIRIKTVKQIAGRFNNHNNDNYNDDNSGDDADEFEEEPDD